jgi:tRNA (adenine58-N1)-methyltransferase non-catalytic subunit
VEEVAHEKESAPTSLKRPRDEGDGEVEPPAKRPAAGTSDSESLNDWIAEGLDAAIVALTSDPLEPVILMTRLVRPGGHIAVFCESPEPLSRIAIALRSNAIAQCVALQSLFQRTYQVKPRATHPMMAMNAASGFLLTAQVMAHPFSAVRPALSSLFGSTTSPPSTAPVRISSVPPPVAAEPEE